MKQLFYFFIIIIITSFTMVGQQSQPNFYCGYDDVIKINELLFPGYKTNVDQSFRYAEAMSSFHYRNTDVLKVKVVIHVVYKTEMENLNDTIIQNQMEVLNKAFRLQNENRTEIRDIFKDIQSDAGIEFELQEVIRVKTNANFALTLTGLPDAVKQNSRGGSDAINPENFLNIWVCRIQPIPFIGGQILGYAYPPSGLANWPEGTAAPSQNLDGVVIDFRVFGSNNPNILTVNGQSHDAQGRTTVHEVGHYLGLRHIWGDGGGIFGGNSCAEDDGMADTPNQGAQSPGGCNKSANTCIDQQNDKPDMIENYMDYSGEVCQNTFTKDQVNLMRSVLMNQRSTLVSAYSIDIEKSWTVYPNPTTDQIFIKNELWSIGNRVLLKNVTGAVVLEAMVSGNLIQMDISQLSQGLYFLEYHNQGKTSIQKIIIHD